MQEGTANITGTGTMVMKLERQPPCYLVIKQGRLKGASGDVYGVSNYEGPSGRRIIQSGKLFKEFDPVGVFYEGDEEEAAFEKAHDEDVILQFAGIKYLIIFDNTDSNIADQSQVGDPDNFWDYTRKRTVT